MISGIGRLFARALPSGIVEAEWKVRFRSSSAICITAGDVNTDAGERGHYVLCATEMNALTLLKIDGNSGTA